MKKFMQQRINTSSQLFCNSSFLGKTSNKSFAVLGEKYNVYNKSLRHAFVNVAIDSMII